MSWELIGFLVLVAISVFWNIIHWRGGNPFNIAIPPFRIMVFIGSIGVLYVYATFFWDLPFYDFWPGPISD